MTKVVPASALYRALQVLTTEIDRDLPITIPLAFLRIAIAGPEGIDQGQLQEELQASGAGMSRAVQTLSRVHWSKTREGLDLIERIIDPLDNRRRILRLTPRGERLAAKVSDVMTKGSSR